MAVSEPTDEAILAEARRLHAEECACHRAVNDDTSGWWEYGRLSLLGVRKEW